jgi:predicted DNA-binding transcriptional regulator AlpA
MSKDAKNSEGVTDAPNPDFMTMDEVRAALPIPISARTIWRMIAKKQFPQPIRMTVKTAFFKTHEVEAFIERKLDGGPIVTRTQGPARGSYGKL